MNDAIRFDVAQTDIDENQRARLGDYFDSIGSSSLAKFIRRIPFEVYRIVVDQYQKSYKEKLAKMANDKDSVARRPAANQFRIQPSLSSGAPPLPTEDPLSLLTTQQIRDLILQYMRNMKEERLMLEEKKEESMVKDQEKREDAEVSVGILQEKIEMIQAALDKNLELTKKLEMALAAKVEGEQGPSGVYRRPQREDLIRKRIRAEQMLAEFLADRGNNVDFDDTLFPRSNIGGANTIFQEYLRANFAKLQPKTMPKHQQNIRRRQPRPTLSRSQAEALRRRSFGLLSANVRSDESLLEKDPSEMTVEELKEAAELRKTIMRLLELEKPEPTRAPRPVTTPEPEPTTQKPDEKKVEPQDETFGEALRVAAEAQRNQTIQAEKAFNTAAAVFQGFVVPRVAPFLVEDGRAVSPFAELLLSMVPGNSIQYLNGQGNIASIPNPALNNPYVEGPPTGGLGSALNFLPDLSGGSNPLVQADPSVPSSPSGLPNLFQSPNPTREENAVMQSLSSIVALLKNERPQAGDTRRFQEQVNYLQALPVRVIDQLLVQSLKEREKTKVNANPSIQETSLERSVGIPDAGFETVAQRTFTRIGDLDDPAPQPEPEFKS